MTTDDMICWFFNKLWFLCLQFFWIYLSIELIQLLKFSFSFVFNLKTIFFTFFYFKFLVFNFTVFIFIQKQNFCVNFMYINKFKNYFITRIDFDKQVKLVKLKLNFINCISVFQFLTLNQIQYLNCVWNWIFIHKNIDSSNC